MVLTDLNNGSIIDDFLSGNKGVPVMINQTSQGNTVQGLIISDEFLTGGIVDINNTANQPLTVHGTNSSDGDFVVNAGVTLNYTGGPFNVTNGFIVIGEGVSDTPNTLSGSGTFNIQSGSFDFDASGTSTHMVVGYAPFGAEGGSDSVVTQGTANTSSTVTTGSSLILGFNSSSGSWTLNNSSILQTGTQASSYLIALGSNGTGSEPADDNGDGSAGTLTIGDNSTFDLGTAGLSTPTDLQVGTTSLNANLTTPVGGSGTITQSGTSTVNIAGMATSVELGTLGDGSPTPMGTFGGTGVYNLVGGTLNVGVNATDAVSFTLGNAVNGSGTLTQTGGILNVGNSTVTNGTTFTVGGAGTGVYNMDGGTANFYNALTVGANGTLNLNGGTLNISTNNLAPSTGTLDFGGGTLKFTGGTTFDDTFSGGTLATGTISTIDAGVGTVTTVTIAQNLTGGGGIRLIGTDGTGGNALTNFTFTGDNDYTGATIIAGGTLTTSAANIQNSSSISILATNNSIGTLNLNLAANGLAFAGSLAGSGNLNINFFDPSGDTFAIKNIGTFTGAITLGANGNAGTLQVYGGTYGNISDAGSGSGVTIGGALPLNLSAFTIPTSGTVTIGNATYTGLTTVNSKFTLNANQLDGAALNHGTLNIRTAGGIAGDVTNTGTLNDVGGITGTVNNSGILLATGSGAMTNTGTLGNSGAAGTTFAVNGTLNSSGTLLVNLQNVPNFSATNATLSGVLKVTGSGTGVYTVVSTTGGITIGGDGMVNDPNGLITSNLHGVLFSSSILPTTSPDLQITTTQRGITQAAQLGLLPNLTYNETQVANSIDPVLVTGNLPFGNQLNDLADVNPALIPKLLDQLSPESLQYARMISFENSNMLAIRMNGVDADLRGGYGGLDTNAISVVTPGFNSGLGRSLGSLLASDDPAFHQSAPNGVNYYPGGGGGAGMSSSSSSSSESSPESEQTWTPSSQVISDNPNPYMANQHPSGPETPNFSGFIGGDVVLADLNEDQSATNAPRTKASYTAGDAIAGVSFRMTSHLAAGVLFDYNHTDAKTDAYGSKTHVDTYSPGFFATYFDHGFYANGLFSFGYNNYSNSRDIGLASETATSHPSGQQYVGDLDLGYDFHPDKSWVVGPTLGVTYTHLDIDSFSEAGAPGTDLTVGSQSADSVRSRLGGHVLFQTNTGDVLLQPNLSLMWQHEYLDNGSGITSSFNDFAANSFTIQTAAPSRDSALITCGLTATLSNSMALYLNYLADVGAGDYVAQSVIGGFKARF